MERLVSVDLDRQRDRDWSAVGLCFFFFFYPFYSLSFFSSFFFYEKKKEITQRLFSHHPVSR